MQNEDLLNQDTIDLFVIIFSIIYNFLIVGIFVFRAREKFSLEERIGPFFDLLIIPFTIFWLLNVIRFNDFGRIGTIIPMIS